MSKLFSFKWNLKGIKHYGLLINNLEVTPGDINTTHRFFLKYPKHRAQLLKNFIKDCSNDSKMLTDWKIKKITEETYLNKEFPPIPRENHPLGIRNEILEFGSWNPSQIGYKLL